MVGASPLRGGLWRRHERRGARERPRRLGAGGGTRGTSSALRVETGRKTRRLNRAPQNDTTQVSSKYEWVVLPRNPVRNVQVDSMDSRDNMDRLRLLSKVGTDMLAFFDSLDGSK